MTFLQVKRALRDTTITGLPKLILAIIADMENDKGIGGAYPAIDTIAELAGISHRHTQRIIKQLTETGHLFIVKQRGKNGTNRYYTYKHPVDNSKQGVTPMSRGGDTHVTPGVTPVSQRGDTHVTRINKNILGINKRGRVAAPRPSDATANKPQTNTIADVIPLEADDTATPRCNHTPDKKNVFQCSVCYAQFKSGTFIERATN